MKNNNIEITGKGWLTLIWQVLLYFLLNFQFN